MTPLPWLARVGLRPSIVRWEKGSSWVDMASRGQWNGPQPCQSRDKLGFPGPAPGQMQGEATLLAQVTDVILLQVNAVTYEYGFGGANFVDSMVLSIGSD